LTSAYFPLAGSVLSDKVWSVLEEGSRKYGPFAHGFTYAAHPLGAATAMANLDILERENLKVRAGEIGGYLLKQLRAAFSDHEMVGDVRGIGLLAAIEFVADKRPPRSFHPDLELGTRIARACREEGVIVRPLPHGDILGFSPPFIVTREEIDEIVERCRRAVARVRDEMIRSGDWRPA
jgi:L-2,4-diaminobutyrate transaminase